MTSVTIKPAKFCDTLLEVDKDQTAVTNDSERNRLQRANNCDRNTLAGIYDDFQPRIYRYIYRQIGDVETTRDLAAEVFKRFLQAVQDGNGPKDHLSAWLYRVAHNLVVDHYRRDKYRQHIPLDQELFASGDDTGQTAEKLVMAGKVRQALRQLTPDQQQVIALKFLEGLSTREVAEITGKQTGAIKSLQHRALAALQRQLLQSEDGERV